mgnify:FL=1
MQAAKENADRDLRLPILLVLAVIILACTEFSPAPERRTSTYYLVPAADRSAPEILRVSEERTSQGELPLNALAITPTLPCGAAPPEYAQLFNLPLPINQADKESLMQLSGIGPKLAERIIAFRETQGPITGPDDFIRVKGIGPKLTARLTPLLCFAPAEITP